MEFISENLISEKLINSFDRKMTLKPAIMQDEENSKQAFDSLKVLSLLSPLTSKSPQLTCDYIHLLKEEHFDEN